MEKKIGRSRGRVLGCGLPLSYIGAVGFINFLSDAKILATTGLHVTMLLLNMKYLNLLVLKHFSAYLGYGKKNVFSKLKLKSSKIPGFVPKKVYVLFFFLIFLVR